MIRVASSPMSAVASWWLSCRFCGNTSGDGGRRWTSSLDRGRGRRLPRNAEVGQTGHAGPDLLNVNACDGRRVVGVGWCREGRPGSTDEGQQRSENGCDGWPWPAMVAANTRRVGKRWTGQGEPPLSWPRTSTDHASAITRMPAGSTQSTISATT